MTDQDIMDLVARLKQERKAFKVRTRDLVKKLVRGIKEEAKNLKGIDAAIGRDIRTALSESEAADESIILPSSDPVMTEIAFSKQKR